MQQEEEKYKERNKDFVGSLLSRKLESKLPLTGLIITDFHIDL